MCIQNIPIVSIGSYFVQFLFAYIFGDFLVGVFHWIKDTYFDPYTPIIGKHLIWPSRLHHIRPRYVIEFSDRTLFLNSALWTSWMLPLLYRSNFDFFGMTLFFVISVNDIVHKYAHMLEYERPCVVTLLQKLYVLQTYDEHHLHHISPHEVNYCPITPYLNIILEYINFWKVLEIVIEKITGVKARAHANEYIEDIHYPAGIKFLER